MSKINQSLLAIWQQTNRNSINLRILRVALVMGGITIGVKLLAMVKDAVLSASFGTTDALDAFLIAFLLPTFLLNLTGGSFSAAIVPTYIQVRENEGNAKARQLFAEVVTLSSGLLLLVTLLSAIGGPLVLPLLGSGFNQAKLDLTQQLYYLLLPIVFLNGLTNVWLAILNAEERFNLGALVPVVISLALIGFMLWLQPTLGVYALVYGTLIGYVVQAFIVAWAVKKRGLSLRPAWPKSGMALQQVRKQFWPIMLGSVLLGSTGMVDQAIGATLAPGSVSALSYGGKLAAVMTSIITVALATAVLPYFSKMAAAANWDGLKRTLKLYTYLVLLVTVPMTLFFCFFSEQLVAFLYQRGAFTHENTLQVAQIQIMYLLQIPLYTLAVFISKLISALNANHVLMLGTIISCILNLVFDIVFVQFIGIAGIALSTTLVYVVSFIFLRYNVGQLLNKHKTFA